MGACVSSDITQKPDGQTWGLRTLSFGVSELPHLGSSCHRRGSRCPVSQLWLANVGFRFMGDVK